jgi:DNA-binding MarR family transcriptional regulator
MNEQQGDREAARVVALAGDLRALIGRLRRRLRDEAPPGDLTPSQTSVLARLEREGPATVTTLARAEGMRPQSMGAIVSALEAAGLVRGAPDPRDGRQTLLSLTAVARETINASRAAKEDWLVRTIRAKLAPDEQDDLARGIALLKRLVDP